MRLPANVSSGKSIGGSVNETPRVADRASRHCDRSMCWHEASAIQACRVCETLTQDSGHAEGFAKIVYDKATRVVLGVHILADGAASILGEGALAVTAGLTIDVMAAAIHPHLTLSESMGLAAREALMPSPHLSPAEAAKSGTHWRPLKATRAGSGGTGALVTQAAFGDASIGRVPAPICWRATSSSTKRRSTNACS